MMVRIELESSSARCSGHFSGQQEASCIPTKLNIITEMMKNTEGGLETVNSFV